MFVTIILTGFHMLFLHLFVQGEVLQVFLLKCEITVSSVNSKQTRPVPAPPCLPVRDQARRMYPSYRLATLLMIHKNKVTHLPGHGDVWKPVPHWLVYRCSYQYPPG